MATMPQVNDYTTPDTPSMNITSMAQINVPNQRNLIELSPHIGIQQIQFELPATVLATTAHPMTINTAIPVPGDDDDDAPFGMGLGADIAWTAGFSLMISSAIVGNLAVFWVILGKNNCIIIVP